MVLYNVVITPTARRLLNEYIDYIQFTLLNPEAADAVLNDALEVIDELTIVADSLDYCQKPALKKLGYRKIFFKRHNYVMLYRIENATVFIDAVYHQMQDYENTFSESL